MVPFGELLGGSPGMVALRDKVMRALRPPSVGGRLPFVFIQGETGTGKTILARSMHRASARRDGPFVELNGSAITETLAEAEMFGHERGAFTDAREARPGFFQRAHTGTLFLDEIALMSPNLQAKLLKVIEDGMVRRVGGTRSESVDVWLITASNDDLAVAAGERRFRADLYHRLARVTLQLPPLRERGNDILLLAEHFLARACQEHGLPLKELAAEARGALLAYHWPGNVRELDNVMERVALFAETDIVAARALELPSTHRPVAEAGPTGVRHEPGRADEQRMLEVWRETNGNLSRAAARLGVKRNTLRHRLQKLGLLARGAGRPLAQEAPTAARPREETAAPPAWESRRLALLRVGLDPRSPDQFRSAGNWIDTVAAKIEAFGGRVLERSATGLTGAFGIEPVEDAPARSAHTAMAVQRAAARARAEGQEVHVTLVVDVRRCQIGFVLGAPTLGPEPKRETWARLDALREGAETDSVVASEAAAAFLDRRFELVPVRTPPREGPRTYRIAGHGRPGLGPGRRISTFVGRHHDVELLKDHLTRVSRGQGHAVGIVGDAGIGKSRLLAEFRRSLAGEEVMYLEGACFSHASAIPYVPVLAILRQSCGIGESDSADVVRSHLAERLESLAMDVEESVPYLVHLLGFHEGAEGLAPLTSEAIRLRTLDVVRRMILGASAQRPVVVVVEDVHWIDKASEEVFSSVAVGLPGAPVLFLSTYRSGFRPSWMNRSFASQMALAPLSSDDSRAMLPSVLEEDVPPAVAEMILDKAEGNPLFIEEICRTVGGHRDPGSITAVPDTIEDILLARVERLPEELRGVLQAAAVLGREFSWQVLENVWSGPGSLETYVALLTEQEFLYQRTGLRERAYAFKHALTQQVAYDSLPPARQRELHAAAGRALERLFSDRLEEAYDRLAYHYARTEEAVKAVAYLNGLAGKAARSGAHEEAVHAWKDALQHVERLPPDLRDRRRFEILLALSGSLLPLGRLGEMSSLLLPERGRLENLRDPSLSARYYFVLSRMYMLGNHALVVDNARRAIAEAERCEDDALMGGAYGVLAVAYALSGRAAQGIECGQRAVKLLEQTKNQWSLSYACWALGLCCSQTGQFEDALAAEQQSLIIAQAIGDAALEVSATWAAGIVRVAMGEWDAGIADCLRAVDVARDVLYRALATAFLGFAYMEKGDAQQAVAALEQAIPLVRRFGLRAYEGWFTAFLAEAYRLLGHLERAEVLSASACEIATEANFPVALGWAQLSLGRIAAARNDLMAAAARLDEALATFTTTHSRYECARTHMERASVEWTRGDRDSARRDLAAAHELFRELSVPRYRERVERLAADWGMSLGSGRRSL
jgi:transcriptional regulator with AAA-type ATPase domain/tetratricopeptide (TPR) repeat protein